MPILKLNVISDDRVLMPPVAVEFDNWPELPEQASDVCRATYESDIRLHAAGDVCLFVQDQDGSVEHLFMIVRGGSVKESRRHIPSNPSETASNLSRCLE